jgi:tripartite-type tricarboxylate transporter receptor subunit TctC
MKAWLAALGALILGAGAAAAQPRAPGSDYPNRPVRIIVAFAAGGNADINARLIGTALSGQIGQQFVVENRPSGGGVVALDTVAKSPPDGYTLLVGALGTHGLSPGLYRNLPVHPLIGLDHITINSLSPLVLAIHPSLPARNFAEFRALLAANPGRYNFGSSGNGSTGHIAAVMLVHMMGVRAQHVPYRGSAAAFTDLAAGRTAFQVDTVSFLESHIREGTVRGLFVATPERSPMLPDLPTSAEAGIPDYIASTWTPWSAPLGTPLPIRQFLYEQIQVALETPSVRDRLVQLGNVVTTGYTPERTRAFIAAEIERWAPIIRVSGATID